MVVKTVKGMAMTFNKLSAHDVKQNSRVSTAGMLTGTVLCTQSYKRWYITNGHCSHRHLQAPGA